jgi:hypothetical protein
MMGAMAVTFVAFYTSSTTSTSGCVKKFVTTERDDLMFPAQVSHRCDMCNTTHSFRLDRVATMATPRQRRSIREYVSEQGIDIDIQIEARTG